MATLEDTRVLTITTDSAPRSNRLYAIVSNRCSFATGPECANLAPPENQSPALLPQWLFAVVG